MPKSPIKTRDFRKIDWEAVRTRMAVAKPGGLGPVPRLPVPEWVMSALPDLSDGVDGPVETIVEPQRPVVERWVRERRSWSAADGNEANPPEAGR